MATDHTPPATLPPLFAEGGAVEERWSVVLAPAGGAARILHVAAHTPGEAVSSPARVLGNGDLKFKYLNPNSLLVAVGVPARAAGSSGGNAGEERLTVVVLDAVTGRVLFSQKHEVRGYTFGDWRGSEW